MFIFIIFFILKETKFFFSYIFNLKYTISFIYTNFIFKSFIIQIEFMLYFPSLFITILLFYLKIISWDNYTMITIVEKRRSDCHKNV